MRRIVRNAFGRVSSRGFLSGYYSGNVDGICSPINISITGFGNVGSTIAEILLHDRFSQHYHYNINIVEPNVDTTQYGKVLDFMQATTIHHRHHSFSINNDEAYLNADFIVHTANIVGTKIKSDRMELLDANKKLSSMLFANKKFTNPNLKIIIVSNPLDIITYFAREYAQLPAQNVVGTGTYLDAMRMKYYIKEKCGIPEYYDINCMVVGEHGPNIVPLFDAAHLNDLRVDEDSPCRLRLLNTNASASSNKNADDISAAAFAELKIDGELRKELCDLVVHAARDIKKTQGCTYFGIATCCISLLHLFLKASMPTSVPAHIIERKTVPLCVQITPHYKELLGIEKDIYLSLPVNIVNTHEANTRAAASIGGSIESIKDRTDTGCYNACPDIAHSHYEVLDSVTCGMSAEEIESLRVAAKAIEASL